MNLPAEIQNYRNRRNAFRGKVPPDVIYRWENHIVPSNLYSLGEEGAYAYLKRRRVSEDNLVHFAIQAEIAGFPDMANGFWKKAYEASKKKDNLTTEAQSLKVFLCHSSSDKPMVRELFYRLRNDGFDPWLDEENLLPGQEWQQEIPRAVKQSDVVLVCLSKTSINKIGYVQREIRYALDVAEEQPEGFIFIIPVKLEECSIPERLRRWQWVDLFRENGYQRLTLSLKARGSIKNL